MLTKVITLLCLVNCMHCAPAQHTAEDFQAKPCAVEDFQCFTEAFETFWTATASGVPDLNIKPNDPLILDSVNSISLIDGTSIHFKNVNVTGLSKQKLTELKVDTTAKSVVFAVTTDVNIASNLEMHYEETKKTLSGTYTASGKPALRVTYDYQLKADDKGVEHFIIAHETITCDFITLQDELNKELLDSIANDSHANKIQKDNEANFDTFKKGYACAVIKAAYARIVDADRIIAKTYPVSAFIINP